MLKSKMIIFLIEKAEKFVLILDNNINLKVVKLLIGQKSNFKDLSVLPIMIFSCLLFQKCFVELVSIFFRSIRKLTK